METAIQIIASILGIVLAYLLALQILKMTRQIIKPTAQEKSINKALRLGRAYKKLVNRKYPKLKVGHCLAFAGPDEIPDRVILRLGFHHAKAETYLDELRLLFTRDVSVYGYSFDFTYIAIHLTELEKGEIAKP